MSRGIVYLVGAGPGDPGLLTVRALELLRAAAVVAYDELVPAAILALANPDAELVAVGRRRGRGRTDYRLHPEVLARAQAGRCVVRLKGGDPMVFGRGAEEAEELAAAGVPFEIVPGVSAALGAASNTGIPLTDRRCASSVKFTTGHVDSAAHQPETLVLYMSGHNLAERLRSLVEEGRPASTPAAYIENATQPAQRTVTGTLADLAMKVEGRRRGGPALVIVGEVVRLRERIAWRERRPLAGRRVLVARAGAETSQLAKELRDLGADVTEAPRVEAAPPSADVRFDLIVLPSSSAAAAVFADPAGVALRAVPMLAMDPSTEQEARARGAATVSRCRRDTIPAMLAAVIEQLAPSARERIRTATSLDGGRAQTGGRR